MGRRDPSGPEPQSGPGPQSPEPQSPGPPSGDRRNSLAETASRTAVGSEQRVMTSETSPPRTPVSTAKHRSRLRALVRALLQRVLFRALVVSTISPTVRIEPRVRGLTEGFLVIANHTSHLDAPLIAQSLPHRQARFLSTGVAYGYFFTASHKRLFVRSLFNAFPVYREGSRGSSEVPRALLRAGVPVLLFPEGGRQQGRVIADFKVGAVKLAVDAGVPIVPAAVVGGFEAMPKGANWPVPGRPPVRIVFGEPVIPRPGESLPALTARVQCLVEELFDSGADAIGVPRLAHRHEKLAPGEEPRTATHAPEPDKQTTQHHWTTAPSPRRHRPRTRGRLGESTDERMRN
ncbi:1-acyl-sn-glycerol-3-phosphate acyltransferase [Brevibacterium casei]|uniref:1-acyl-sn-glycerol-3-phosphate acyltransferase n=2 Tax=Brevibacterium casei TaxID=33889 RepID=A0A7T4DK10_9MICO|nr:1-acyl-sn-glycerol-3-phosphate acyltransferase [Brevibacterium casei]